MDLPFSDDRELPLTWGWVFTCVKPGPSGVVNEPGAWYERVPVFRCKCWKFNGGAPTGSMSVLFYPPSVDAQWKRKARWSVSEQGLVSPSILCDPKKGGCGFHESGIVLVGYVPQKGQLYDNSLNPISVP